MPVKKQDQSYHKLSKTEAKRRQRGSFLPALTREAKREARKKMYSTTNHKFKVSF
jgi:hypothetical protein